MRICNTTAYNQYFGWANSKLASGQWSRDLDFLLCFDPRFISSCLSGSLAYRLEPDERESFKQALRCDLQKKKPSVAVKPVVVKPVAAETEEEQAKTSETMASVTSVSSFDIEPGSIADLQRRSMLETQGIGQPGTATAATINNFFSE
jgi:hypothetical protein